MSRPSGPTWLHFGVGPRAADVRGAATRDLGVDLFGLVASSPLVMAPIGVIGLCAQDGQGDLVTASAAARTGVPMIASTLSMCPMEDVAAVDGRHSRLLSAVHANGPGS